MTPPALDLDWAHVLAILPDYVEAVPRYTSYPPAPVWTEAYDDDAFARDLAALEDRGAEGVSLYVHVPFCRSLCHFCACNRVVTRDPELPARWLADLELEIARVRAALPGPLAAAQVHLGGGTPTHLAPAPLTRVFEALARAFPLRPGAELSVEVDPRVTTAAHVHALRACGVRRLSLGVQDFDPRVQAAIHREQSVDTTRRLVGQARAAGIRSVGFDLIYGLPFQTPASLARTLDAVVELRPDRIALYGYAHVTWVAKQQRGFERHDLPEPAARLALFVLALRRLLDAGYRHVGMDHFALPHDDLACAAEDGRLCRNFMGYTTRAGAALLGFGPSAISELPGAYAQSRRDLEAWGEAVRAGRLATLRGHRLTADDQARRFVIEALFCRGEVASEEHARRFGESLAARYARELARLRAMAEAGLVEIAADGSLRLRPLGRLLVRNVAAVFDAHLAAQRATAGPRFSAAV